MCFLSQKALKDMTYKRFATALALIQATFGQTETNYDFFAAAAQDVGVSWAPYEVKTSDGWYVTVFHVYGE